MEVWISQRMYSELKNKFDVADDEVRLGDEAGNWTKTRDALAKIIASASGKNMRWQIEIETAADAAEFCTEMFNAVEIEQSPGNDRRFGNQMLDIVIYVQQHFSLERSKLNVYHSDAT